MSRPRALIGLAIGIALIAFNLRFAVAAVGPVLPELRADLALSATATAVLTMLPVLCFGVLAAVAPRLAGGVRIEVVLLGAMTLLAVGLLGRVLAGPGLLFAGTILAGGAIAVANVLVPPLVKRDFPAHTGTMMGVYTMAVTASAAVAAGLTVPAGELIGQGWRGALAVWALPAALAVVLWLPQVRRSGRLPRHGPPGPPPAGGSMLRSRLAWQVTVFFGLQSMMFYATLAWLPSIYRDHGYDAATAGLLVSVSGLVQIPVALVLPGVATRARNQIPHVVVFSLVLAAGVAGVLLAPTAAPYLWVVLLGIGCGGCFALALVLFVLRAGEIRDTARLSAMAQSVGYLISACGPLLFGVVYDLTESWTPPLVMLLLCVVPQLWLGILASRARLIELRGPRERLPQGRDGNLAVKRRR